MRGRYTSAFVRTRILLAVLSLVCCGAAFATPVRLIAPSAGVTLRGDHFATIAWVADRRVEAEEWEAFLSVDGGRYYSVRITPHLDLDVRTFEFLVPNIASDDVRLLMRVGDEHIETIIQFPQRFSIRPSPSTVVGQRLTAEPGPESARPGEAVVVQWATGGRDGARAEVAQSRPSGAALRRRICDGNAHSNFGLTRDQAPVSALMLTIGVTSTPRIKHAAASTSPHAPDLLRLATRLNV
jgi:hypothetical protein